LLVTALFWAIINLIVYGCPHAHSLTVIYCQCQAMPPTIQTPLRPPPTPPYHFDALYFCAMFVVLCLLPTARVKKCTPAQRISHFAMSAGKNKAKAATEIAAKRLNLNISL